MGDQGGRGNGRGERGRVTMGGLVEGRSGVEVRRKFWRDREKRRKRKTLKMMEK